MTLCRIVVAAVVGEIDFLVGGALFALFRFGLKITLDSTGGLHFNTKQFSDFSWTIPSNDLEMAGSTQTCYFCSTALCGDDAVVLLKVIYHHHVAETMYR